ncbi:MAG: EVE domain-containing protein [Proteobacteria bacterium]|nr:EVE domain-containing protein [Pseudomonadota bacterium]MBI3495895.1 EVE domain-containing protein [Pseudomonadota bacterium]
MNGNWIAVASADHVRRGVALGIMQVCHGKAAPLKRLMPGDRVAYYSPRTEMRKGEALRCFTALGVVADGEVHQADMGGGFRPFRRRVRYLEARPAPVETLLALPGFALSGAAWGARLRFGLVGIDEASMDRIAEAMGIKPGDGKSKINRRERREIAESAEVT